MTLTSEPASTPEKRDRGGGSAWVEHARVVWVEADQPWHAERALIRRLALPLNLQDNAHGAFYLPLNALRRTQKQNARTLAGV